MRTKLFLAFCVVIALALQSNLAFRELALSDFEDFIEGGREDAVYVVTAALESAREGGHWDDEHLADIAVWALTLGFEVRVFDAGGGLRIDTGRALRAAGPMTRRRLEGLECLPVRASGPFESYPLFLMGEQIGRLEIRPTARRESGGPRARVFRERARSFLFVSLAATGAAAFVVGLAFIFSLSRPVRALTRAVRAVASGRLDVRVEVGRSRDEIAALGRAFNAMAETLERQERLRQDLVTDLAHELRTPITVLLGTLEAIEDGVRKADRETLASIREEVSRMARFVPVLEDLARSESGYIFVKREPVDLFRVVSDVASGLAPAFERKGLALELVPPGGGPVIVPADPDKVAQVVVNLMTNALRHTEEGRVRVTAGADRDWGFVEVADTGPGIPPEIRSRIFDRFVRGENSEGRGVGLTIVRRIVESHDGIVELADRPGGGAVFTVRFPKAEGGRAAGGAA